MDSVETVIRFRESPSEGDSMSVTISIVLDVFTGYIMKNGSGWCTWVGGKTDSWKSCQCFERGKKCWRNVKKR